MHAVRAATFAIVFAALAVLAGCSREQRDWRSTQAADSIEAYGTFLRTHPDGRHAPEARTRIEQLGEDRDWERARAANTRLAYQQFVTQHPSGKWTEEARIRVENFDLNAAPQPVPEQPASAQAEPAPAEPAPAAPTPETKADQPPARTGTASSGAGISKQTTAAAPPGFGVQLGAFSNADRANVTWQRLKAHFGSQLGALTPRVEAAQTSAGRLFRLRAATRSEAEARSICEALKKQLEQCSVYLPGG